MCCALSSDESAYENATVDQPQVDSFSLVLTLSEKQRVAAIFVSNTSGGSGQNGGDGTPLIVDVKQAAIKDIGTNDNLAQPSIFATEIADTTIPLLTSVSLDLNNGLREMQARQ